MEKYIPLNKRSKKEQKEYHAKQRLINGFNTGSRPFKTDKQPSRARAKELTRKEFNL